MWIVISLVMIVISVFDSIPGYFAKLLGFELTSNFLLSLTIFFPVGHWIFANHDFVKTKRTDKAFSSRIIYFKKSSRNERGE